MNTLKKKSIINKYTLGIITKLLPSSLMSTFFISKKYSSIRFCVYEGQILLSIKIPSIWAWFL